MYYTDKGKEMISESYKYPNIRVVTIGYNPSSRVVDILTDKMLKNKWSIANNKSLSPIGGYNTVRSLFTKFSGVCYMFGLELHKKLKV